MKNYKKALVANSSTFPFALSMTFLIYFIGNSLNAQPAQKKETQKEIKDTQLLKSFEGYYQFQDDKNTFLQIIAKGSNLILKQLWDGKEIVFVQKSELDFFNEEESFHLNSVKTKMGRSLKCLPLTEIYGIKLRIINRQQKKKFSFPHNN